MIGYEDKRKKMREIDCLKDGGNTNGDRQRVVYKESERERERKRERMSKKIVLISKNVMIKKHDWMNVPNLKWMKEIDEGDIIFEPV